MKEKIVSLKSLKKGVGSISQKYVSTDPDPHQNVTDPQHCCEGETVTLRYLEGALKLEDLSDEPSLLLLLFRRELGIKTLLTPLNAFIRHSWRI